MALRNNFSQTILRNFIILISLFVGMLVFSSILFFQTFKEKSLKNAKNDYEIKIKYYSEEIKKKILLDDMESVFNLTEEVNKSDFIENIDINLNRYIFNKDTLLFKTLSFNDKAWELGNIEIDIKYGTIHKLNNSFYYEFVPSQNFDIKEDVIIRYQAYKGSEIRNFLTRLNFGVETSKALKIHENSIPSWFDYIFAPVFSSQEVKLEHNNINIATLKYNLDDHIVRYDIYEFIINLLIYTVVVFLPIMIVINFYQRYVYKNYVVKPIHYLNVFVDDILNKKFKKIEKNQFEDTKDFQELTTNVSKLSTNMASLVNELNISKETLERKMSTDNLTGLANQKVFDLDMKSMFVSSINAYILLLKIENLQNVKSSTGNEINSDDFIQSFVNNVNNSIHKNRRLDIKFYRFYGLEFCLVLKKVPYEKCEEIAKDIIDNLEEKLSSSYSLPENFVNIGGTPFDVYGSSISILKNAKKAYLESKEINKNSYVIVKETESQQENDILETNVNRVIDNNDFNIDFIYDTFSLYDGSIIMKELRPILMDSDNNEIAIGSFVSVAEKLRRAYEFDKEVILKTLDYMKSNEVPYKIAVNLSIESASDYRFMDFLKDTIEQTDLLKEKIVFSITSYTASSYKSRFIDFVDKMSELGIEVLLKRYQTKEISLDELSNVKVDYIRMHKEYTNNIHSDLVKKHKIKNIIIFGELNNIKIMADSVESDMDYALLDRLDLYATSR